MHKTLAVTLLLISSLASPALSEKITPENIVVTPARIQESEAEATRPVTVIRRDEIERTGLVFLDELLMRIGVVQVLRDGAAGAPSRLMARGTGPLYSVILMDGVRVASAIDGYADLSGITLEDVERIEISHGAHSASYGSQAIGGVVNIISRRGGGPFSAGLSYSGGSEGSQSPSVTVSGGKSFRYRLSASDNSSDGISSIRYGAEADGYELRSYSGHVSMPMGKGGVIEVLARRDDMERSLDRGPELLPLGLADDPDLKEQRRRDLLITRLTYSGGGSVVHTITASKWEEDSTLQDPSYSFFNTISSALEGIAPYRREALTTMRAYEYQASVYEEEGGVGIIGVERREETASVLINSGSPGDFSNTVSLNAAYVNLKMEDGPYKFVFGSRRTEHEISGDYVTYSVSAFQQDEGSAYRYRASWATGLRLPSLYELNMSGGGQLRPELSRNWEAGFEKLYGKGRSFGVLYFEQEIMDIIEQDTVSGLPVNGGSARIKGVEVSMGSPAQDPGKTGWTLSYTWLDARDPETGKRLPLRPSDRIDLRVGYSGGSLGLQLDCSYVGKRPGQAAATELGSYALVNLGGSYRLGDTFSIFGRVDNALDRQYIEMAGYSAPGREYTAGLKARF